MKCNCEVCQKKDYLFHIDGTRICLSCMRIYDLKKSEKIIEKSFEDHYKLLRYVSELCNSDIADISSSAKKCLGSLCK